MIEIRQIDRAHQQDIRLPNEPFALFGRMIPAYVDEAWSHSEVVFPEEERGEMCFPDEAYDFGAMEADSVFLGAYDGDACVGLAVLKDAWFQYMYLYDFKVNRAYRGRGVAADLIAKAKEVAAGRGYRGLYTQGQDNNLGACRFYLKAGFRIGGLDTQVYKGTSQEGKADIIFYLD